MRGFRSDLSRVLTKPFAFCLLGTMLCVLFGAFSDVLTIYMLDAPTAALWAHQGITVKALAGDCRFVKHVGQYSYEGNRRESYTVKGA